MIPRFIILAGALLGPLALPAWALPSRMGDMDEDGVPTVADLSRVLRHIEGSAPLGDTLWPFADLNQDGAINGLDLDELVKEILGTRTPELLPLASVRESSPAAGEGTVALSRETVVRFTMPLAVNTVIDTNQLYATFGGRKILSRAELSGDRLKATLFYLEPLPSNARVRVFLEAPALRDVLGREIDADGDGVAGGAFAVAFDTLSVTPLPGTSISGRVFASERGTGGAEVPLAGVTISVDGAEQELQAVTNAQGTFTLSPCPAGSFFVSIDGRTAAGGAWPDGAYYPPVGKRWEAVAGRTDNLAGNSEDTPRTGNIYLPLIRAGTLQTVSAAQPTVIDPLPALLAADPRLTGLQLLVPAGSLFRDDGSRGGKVGVAPVAPDRLPSPLPPGLALPLVITIQTDGPTNFDRPVAICFPNLPDPLTGIKLPPGGKSALWSFNHDIGSWEVAGPMTVTPDGLFVKSDPGTGVRQPGWHGPSPGSGASGAGDSCTAEVALAEAKRCQLEPGTPCKKWDASGSWLKDFAGTGSSCQKPATAEKAPIRDAVDSLKDTGEAFAAANGIKVDLAAAAALVKQGVAVANEAEAAINKAKREVAKLGANIRKVINNPLTLFGIQNNQPPAQEPWGIISYKKLAAAMRCVKEEVETKKSIVDQLAAANIPGAAQTSQILNNVISGAGSAAAAGAAAFQTQFGPSLSGVVQHATQLGTILNPVLSALAPFLPPPPGAIVPRDGQTITLAQIEALQAVVDEMIPHLEVLQQFSESNEQLLDGARSNEELIMQWQSIATEANGGSDPGNTPPGQRFVKVTSTDEFGLNPLTVRFRTGLDGTVRVILRPRAAFTLVKFDPAQHLLATCSGWAADNGQNTELPGADLRLLEGTVDTDGDGLPDGAEDVVGTDANHADSDGDGIRDLDEVTQGTDPLTGAPAQTGAIANLPTAGFASDVAAFGEVVAVAGRNYGLEIFRAQAGGVQPVRMASFPLMNSICNAAAVNDRYAAVASSTGVHFVATATAGDPAVQIRSVPAGGEATCLALDAGTAYLGTSTGKVLEVDLDAATVISQLDVAAPVEDLVINGGVLYVYRRGWSVAAIPLAARPLAISGAVNLTGGLYYNRRHRLTAAGPVLYAQHIKGWHIIDVSNPAQPAVVENFESTQFGWRQVTSNGSGLGIVITGISASDDLPRDVELYNLGANGRAHDFLTPMGLDVQGEALAIHNGQAWLAAGPHGLFVINYRAFEQSGTPPAISLTGSVPLTAGLVEEGKLMRLFAAVTDDVQVRSVDFLIDGVRTATDGGFPFEYVFLAPDRTPVKTSVTVQAIARDTSGKTAASPVYTLTLTLDATPPVVLASTPLADAILGATTSVAVTFSEPMNVASLAGNSLFVVGAGPDRLFGTADDTHPAPTVAPRTARDYTLLFAAALPAGRYRLQVGSPAADAAGNPLVDPFAADFLIASAVDTDLDGVPDDWETAYGLNPGLVDSDGDSLSDGQEDLDGDTLTNAVEIALGFDPTKDDSNDNGIPDAAEDADNDGLADAVELAVGTDPANPDTDGDGYADEAEVTGGSDPLMASSTPLLLPGSIAARYEHHVLRFNTDGSNLPLAVTQATQPFSGVLRLDDPVTGARPSGTPAFQPDANILRLDDPVTGARPPGTPAAQPPVKVDSTP